MNPASGVSFDRKIEGDSAARRVLAIKFLSALHDGAFKSPEVLISPCIWYLLGEILSVKREHVEEIIGVGVPKSMSNSKKRRSILSPLIT